MNKGRSFCATCRVEIKSTNLMTIEEGMIHQDQNMNHHVILNDDAKEDDSNGLRGHV